MKVTRNLSQKSPAVRLVHLSNFHIEIPVIRVYWSEFNNDTDAIAREILKQHSQLSTIVTAKP